MATASDPRPTADLSTVQLADELATIADRLEALSLHRSLSQSMRRIVQSAAMSLASLADILRRTTAMLGRSS
jgi:hypothetical protein